MDHYYECPDCGNRHDEPASAVFALAVRCLDCELEALYRAERDAGFELIPRAA